MKPWSELSPRERDALVAESIFGWKLNPAKNHDHGVDWIDEEGHQGWTSDISKYWQGPPYSTDIKAAWHVVEKFKCLEPELRWDDENHGWYLSFSKKDLGILPYAPTAPEAICLSGLRAVGG